MREGGDAGRARERDREIAREPGESDTTCTPCFRTDLASPASWPVLYFSIPYHTIPYHTIPYHTILYYTILYYTIIYYMYYTILYYTILLYYSWLHGCPRGWVGPRRRRPIIYIYIYIYIYIHTHIYYVYNMYIYIYIYISCRRPRRSPPCSPSPPRSPRPGARQSGLF